MARLDAILLARPSWPTTKILKGTARERFDDALALCDESALTIVVNSYALGYFTESDQMAFFDEMTRRCATSNVAWISLESPSWFSGRPRTPRVIRLEMAPPRYS